MICWFWPVKIFWYCPSAEIYNVKFFFLHRDVGTAPPRQFRPVTSSLSWRDSGVVDKVRQACSYIPFELARLYTLAREKKCRCVAFFHQRVFYYFEISTVGYPRYWYLPIKSNFSWSMASMSVKFIVHPTSETGATSTGKKSSSPQRIRVVLINNANAKSRPIWPF